MTHPQTKADDQAFPCSDGTPGMTIREHMATEILAGLMANPERYQYVVSMMDTSLPHPWTQKTATRHNAEKAVYLANALIEALNAER